MHHLFWLLPLLGMAAAPILLPRPYRGVSINNVPNLAVSLPIGTIFAVPNYSSMHSPLQIGWDTAFAGTALATVNVRLEGTNVDNPQNAPLSAWADLDDSSLVTGETRFVSGKEVKFVRGHVTVATGGDGTSAVTVGIKFN